MAETRRFGANGKSYCASCRRDYQKTRPRDQREARRRFKLKSKYGMSIDQFNAILASQDGVCAICHRSNWDHNGPSVDHDHVTGKVRGILCGPCNTGLGRFNDSIGLLSNATEYLKKYQG